MPDERKVAKRVVMETTPELAFEAATEARELREWLCDQAWTEVRPGGRYEVRWNEGYRAEGKFTELDPPRRAAFTWQGRGEPGETAVEVTIEPTEDGVEISLIHSGFGWSGQWDEAASQAEKGWTTGLENLKSTLETGVDLRLARQPFLGINFDILDAERAADEGIAAERGIYVTGTAEGSGARAAGLKKGDVIVALGGVPTPGFQELNTALRSHRAGDLVDLDLVRGQKQETVQATLGERPREEVPGTAAGLAQLVAQRYGETDAELQAAVEGLREEEAGQPPAGGRWSVKQVLAHLSIVEREMQSYLANVALNGWLDGGLSNPTVIPGRLEAVLAATPTLRGLLERFFADEEETVTFLGGLPKETVAHKARFYRIGQLALSLPAEHTRGHTEQIKGAIEALRG